MAAAASPPTSRQCSHPVTQQTRRTSLLLPGAKMPTREYSVLQPYRGAYAPSASQRSQSHSRSPGFSHRSATVCSSVTGVQSFSILRHARHSHDACRMLISLLTHAPVKEAKGQHGNSS